VQASVDWRWLLAFVVGMPGLLALTMWKARDRTAAVVPWSCLAIACAGLLAGTTDLAIGPIFAALVLTVGEVLVLTAVALFFSAFSSPFLTALFTFGVWIVGRSADTMLTMKSRAIPDVAKSLLRELGRVWPNFNLFVPGRHTLETHLVEGGIGPLSYVLNNMLYAGAYSLLMLVLAGLIFQRRNFL
jgi:Cu-processing system permease protein